MGGREVKPDPRIDGEAEGRMDDMNDGADGNRLGEREGRDMSGKERLDFSIKGSSTYSLSLPSPSSVQQHPIIHPILDFPSRSKRLGEKVTKEVVIRTFGESELSNVVEVDGEFL